MIGPEQVPDDTPSDKWNDWQDHKLDGKSSEFSYSDSTEEHIGGGESQHFKYGRTNTTDK